MRDQRYYIGEMKHPKAHQEDQLDLKAVLATKKICFICNILRESNDHEYKHEGLRRCTEKRTAKKTCDRIAIYLPDTSNLFYNTAIRLKMNISF